MNGKDQLNAPPSTNFQTQPMEKTAAPNQIIVSERGPVPVTSFSDKAVPAKNSEAKNAKIKELFSIHIQITSALIIRLPS